VYNNEDISGFSQIKFKFQDGFKFKIINKRHEIIPISQTATFSTSYLNGGWLKTRLIIAFIKQKLRITS